MMNNSQFHELFGSQWPPDQHGGHSSASTMLHQGQNLPQGMQLKREPHEVQGVMHNQMGMDINSGSVADSTSPPPGNSEGMFGSSMSGMFMDKKAANSIRGKCQCFFYSFFFNSTLYTTQRMITECLKVKLNEVKFIFNNEND